MLRQISFSDKVKEQLRLLGVKTVYLFGSRAQGMAGPLSDYDFAVLTEKSGHQRGGQLYDALYDILAPLCPRSFKNDVIDIVFLNDAPLELQFHVIRYGKLLLDLDPLGRGRFEEGVMERYCDFRPILDMFDQAILASI